ncbi:MAG: hypothetical protein KBI32_14915, partial [Phycisphaerae bacterium]|nr:hypothetical protein [Phycisphaerae bacterium]
MNFSDKIRLSVKAARYLTEVRQIVNADEQTLDEIERVLIRHLTGILGYRLMMADYIQGSGVPRDADFERG